MDFLKKDLLALIYGENVYYLDLIYDKQMDNDRWSIHHDIVFKHLETGKFYSSSYSVGATEYQDERPWEYAGDVIHCIEVVPVVVSVTKYVPANIH